MTFLQSKPIDIGGILPQGCSRCKESRNLFQVQQENLREILVLNVVRFLPLVEMTRGKVEITTVFCPSNTSTY